MRCESCGQEYQAHEKFCKNCGSKLKQEEVNDSSSISEKSNAQSTSEQKKANPSKRIMPILAAVAAVIIAAIFVLPNLFKSSPYELRKNEIQSFNTKDTTVFLGKNNKKIILDEVSNSYAYSLDRSKAAVLTNITETGGTLWYITQEEKVKAADGVFGFVLSDNGEGIAYYTDYNSKENIASLQLYDCNKKKSSKVAGEVVFIQGNWNGLCISPDGKTVGYIDDLNVNTSEFSGYISVNGKKPEKFGSNKAYVAISNKGTYGYYMQVDSDGSTSSFYAKKGKNETKLAADMDSLQTISFNKDYSQIVFYYDGKTYISKQAKEKEKISNSYMNFLVPEYAQTRFMLTMDSQAVVYGINSFSNMTALSEDGLVYINDKYEVSKIASGIQQAMVTSNGKTVVYSDGAGSLFRKTDLSSSDKAAKELGKDLKISKIAISQDSSKIYYVNTDAELWYVSGNGKPKKIADDVDLGSLYINQKGNTAFFLVDYDTDNGMLYYSKNGGKKKKVEGGDEVYRVYAISSGVVYYSNYSNEDEACDLYFSDGAPKFEKIIENVSIY